MAKFGTLTILFKETMLFLHSIEDRIKNLPLDKSGNKRLLLEWAIEENAPKVGRDLFLYYVLWIERRINKPIEDVEKNNNDKACLLLGIEKNCRGFLDNGDLTPADRQKWRQFFDVIFFKDSKWF